MSQIINNLYETFHYLSAVICQTLTTSKRCWQDNLEFHRCLVSYGNCSKMLPLFVATNIFMSKLSVADLRGILSRIFEHRSVIKIKQVSRFFVQKQEILYNNLFYFTRNKLWWWSNNTPSVCLLSGATRAFCLTRIFCQIFENLYLDWQTEFKDKSWSKLVRLWPDGLCSIMPDFIRNIKLKSKLNPCRLGKLTQLLQVQVWSK